SIEAVVLGLAVEDVVALAAAQAVAAGSAIGEVVSALGVHAVVAIQGLDFVRAAGAGDVAAGADAVVITGPLMSPRRQA
ncbi:MAG: hypothetical protein L0Y32_04180, partial [Nevskiales bacterium]|nr:hypothetical protein [Nevskiales bacterium]